MAMRDRYPVLRFAYEWQFINGRLGDGAVFSDDALACGYWTIWRSAYLTNQFLIAMPGMDDPNFAQTVTLICEHSEQGALGIVINGRCR